MTVRGKSKRKDDKFQTLCRLITKDMQRLHVPGVAVGVLHQGRVYSAGFGVTSVENPLPVTPDTLFQVGSITKTFTGTILMQLAGRGIIDLDAPVRRYIKDFKLRDKKVAARVTIRHLLTHTGGWVGDYFNDFGNGDDALAKMVRDIGRLPQVMPLGEIWSYNNTGFNIASRLIEVVTRKPYEQVVQEMLLGPLGLDMTFFFPDDILITHRFVVGHQRVAGKTVLARPWAIGRAGNGVGGIVSTVKDLLKYARFHMGDGGSGNGKRVIKQKSLQAMRVPQVDTGGRGSMGITWFIRKAGRLTVYSHGGATNGQMASLYYIPDGKFALAILANSDDGRIITTTALEWVLDLYFQTRLETHRPMKIPAGKLREYTGSYRIGTEAFRLKAERGFLVYHHIPLGGFPKPDSPPGPALPPIRFGFFEQDQVVGLDEPMKDEIGDFIRDKNGKPAFFRIDGRAHKRLK